MTGGRSVALTAADPVALRAESTSERWLLPSMVIGM